MSTIVPQVVANRILLLRGQRVMLDADLADLYGVETRVLNQAVKRNAERFPLDFMFQLNAAEKAEVVTNCDHLAKLKFSPSLPYAFTEHGALMLGNVLKSSRAVEVSLLVVRAFVQIREMLSTHKELAAKLDQLERKVSSHDQAIAGLIDAIRQLMAPPVPTRRGIGFTADMDSKPRNKK
ncbi:MAG: ORF6N domain-containing protein [Rhodocyclales bacterium]|nr:ORF6N domain-containing protein [Rhodocyclales bacterium]